MAFTVYANKLNKHVTIHRDGCGHINKHGGVDQYGNGWYEHFETYEDARAYSQTTGQRLAVAPSDCSACKPRG